MVSLTEGPLFRSPVFSCYLYKAYMPGPSGTQKFDKKLDKSNGPDVTSKDEKVDSKPAKFDPTNVCFFNALNK